MTSAAAGARRAWCAGSLACVLAGCALIEPAQPPAVEESSQWRAVALPGKRQTAYDPVVKAGRSAIRAIADHSASMWRSKLDLAADQIGEIRFSWWVDELMPDARIGVAGREDAVARVILAFDGDRSRLEPRNRALFDLAHALTGESPPYATLVYVWDHSAAVDAVLTNSRSDRIRYIVLDSGPANLGRWRDHRRDIAADYRRAFNEAPGRLIGVALMTDGDNTGSAAQAWYGEIEFLGP